MIFVGREKAIVDRLLAHDPKVYEERSELQRIFHETVYGIRFTPFVIETLKKTHKTLGYSLRQQYPEAKHIFDYLLNPPLDVALSSTQDVTTFAFGVWERLKNADDMTSTHILTYYKHLRDNLIFPVMKRFGYFSPAMTVVVFYSLLLHLGELYIHGSYALVMKHFIRDRYPRVHLEILAHCFDKCDQHTKLQHSDIQMDLDLLRIELNVWNAK
jgi:hypothetical protein